eukprot:scaffold65035_cov72-Phaeocystis_antarctica.AAC.1
MATPGVREHFLFAPPAGEAAAEGELTATLRRFVLELHAHGRPERPIRPTEMLQAVANLDARYARRGAEQDSHEVLRQLLEGIRSEEVARLRADGAAAKPEPTTLIDDIYAGEIRSSVVCLGCGGVSCSTEPITDLSLPIPHSRRGALEAPPEPPTLAGPAATAAHEGGDGAAAADGDAAAHKMHEMRERVLAKLPHELKVPPAQLGLAACLQMHRCGARAGCRRRAAATAADGAACAQVAAGGAHAARANAAPEALPLGGLQGAQGRRLRALPAAARPLAVRVRRHARGALHGLGGPQRRAVGRGGGGAGARGADAGARGADGALRRGAARGQLRGRALCAAAARPP